MNSFNDWWEILDKVRLSSRETKLVKILAYGSRFVDIFPYCVIVKYLTDKFDGWPCTGLLKSNEKFDRFTSQKGQNFPWS